MGFARFMATPVGRIGRMVAGIALVIIGLLIGGVGGWIVAILGLVPLGAGAFDVCVLAPILRAPFRGRDVRS
jgi:hypothetical protein